MKKAILLVLTLGAVFASHSQKKDKILFTIGDENTTISEFKKVYEKNLDAIDDEESKNVTNNLNLLINYKLKVKQAYDIKLDTLPSYKREMETYKNQLSAPYLKDTTFMEKLVKDAYYRTKNEVKAKHILVRMQNSALPKDTLIAYNKIIAIRNRAINGEDFEKLAVETSEDTSARDDEKMKRKGNKGNLGYFSAFRMVYPFEVAAYSTKTGEVSMPFKTRFGYHIIKVDSFRLSEGEVEAAHLLIRDLNASGKQKIDEVYTKLEKGEKFEDVVQQYSEDVNSKTRGGALGKFGRGRMVKPFEDAIFGLNENGSYSKPFKTQYGWHIVKLIKKIPVPSFKEAEAGLRDKIRKSSRMQISDKVLVNKLKKKYTIEENESAKKIFDNKNFRAIPADSLQNILFSINAKNITQEEFVKYTRNRRHKPVFTLFEMFKEQEIINYYKENLIYTEPEYAATLKEYEDGLLLFELMQQKIWNKSAQDTLGLQNYFETNKSNYKPQVLDSIKGQVMNDYQNYLDESWIADLRKEHIINVNKRQLNKLIKYYRKEE